MVDETRLRLYVATSYHHMPSHDATLLKIRRRNNVRQGHKCNTQVKARLRELPRRLGNEHGITQPGLHLFAASQATTQSKETK